MRRALLTIDDAPTNLTADILSYVQERNLDCVFFCIGRQLLEYPAEADKIVQAGYTLGNHSFSHPAFSTLTLDEAITEIDKTERAIEEVYARNGKTRTQKHFRFPYGDKGGERKEVLQGALASRGFRQPLGLNITYDWFYASSLNSERDTFWTFDTVDYKVSDPLLNYTMQHLIDHIDDVNPPWGGNLSVGDSDEIVLMHDHPSTHAKVPRYWAELIERIEGKGISFVKRAQGGHHGTSDFCHQHHPRRLRRPPRGHRR